MNRPKYLGWMHGIGVVLSVMALIVGGFHSPAIGFPVAVAILIAFEVPAPLSLSSRFLLRTIYGNIKGGGIRRGIFIKEMFALAVIYLSIGSFAFGMRVAGFSNALLGAALVISSIASEIEANKIRRAIE